MRHDTLTVRLAYDRATMRIGRLTTLGAIGLTRHPPPPPTSDLGPAER